MNTAAPGHRGPLAHAVILLSFGHLLAFVDRAKVAGALPAIRQQVAMSDQAAAWVIGTAFALSYGVTLLAFALLRRGERAQARWRLPGGVVLWGAASAATGLADSLPALIAARVALGIGQALFIPVALTYLVETSGSPGARATSLSIFTSAASLGRSAGLLMIGAALAFVQVFDIGGASPNWRWAFLLTALLNLILLGLLVGVGLRATAPARPEAIATQPEAKVPILLSCAYLLLAVAPIMLIQATIGWLPSLFVRELGASVQQASIWLGAIVVVGGPGGQLLGGWLLRRASGWSAAIPLVVAGGMAAALPGYTLVVWGGGVVAATLGVLAIYLPLGVAGFAALFGWQNLIASERRMAGNGVYLALITTVGVGLGPLVTGVLADRGATLGTALVETALGCVALAVCVAALIQPRYHAFRLA